MILDFSFILIWMHGILILIAVSWYLLDIYDIAWLKRTILFLTDPLFHWSVDFVRYSNNEAGAEIETEAK